jgi:hypothetical protein
VERDGVTCNDGGELVNDDGDDNDYDRDAGRVRERGYKYV